MFDILSQFARGTEKILDVGIAGIISSVTMLVSNILFLVYFHMGLTGYFLANCLAYILSDAYLFIRLKIWKYIKVQNINKEVQKEMVKYSVPMGLGNIGWWINNVSDRYISYMDLRSRCEWNIFSCLQNTIFIIYVPTNI